MVNERDDNASRGDAFENDPLEDMNLDELDLDSLLENPDGSKAPTRQTPPGAGKPPSDLRDLSDGDDEFSSGSDLLDSIRLGDEVGAGPGGSSEPTDLLSDSELGEVLDLGHSSSKPAPSQSGSGAPDAIPDTLPEDLLAQFDDSSDASQSDEIHILAESSVHETSIVDDGSVRPLEPSASDIADDVSEDMDQFLSGLESGGDDTEALDGDDLLGDLAGASNVGEDLLDVDSLIGEGGSSRDAQASVDDLLGDDSSGEPTEFLASAEEDSSEFDDLLGDIGEKVSDAGDELADDIAGIDIDGDGDGDLGSGAAAAGAVGAAAGNAMGLVSSDDDEDSGGRKSRGLKGKGRGKLGTAKGSRKSGKGDRGPAKGGISKKRGAPKKGSSPKKSRAVKERKPAAAKPVRAGKALSFVCSECYTTISLPVNYSKEKVTCPECFHVGKKPDEDFLRTVGTHKNGERSSFVLTCIVGLLTLIVLAAAVWLRTPYGTMEGDDLSTWTMVLLGGGGLLTIIFLALLWRFENNRWEAYF